MYLSDFFFQYPNLVIYVFSINYFRLWVSVTLMIFISIKGVELFLVDFLLFLFRMSLVTLINMFWSSSLFILTETNVDNINRYIHLLGFLICLFVYFWRTLINRQYRSNVWYSHCMFSIKETVCVRYLSSLD